MYADDTPTGPVTLPTNEDLAEPRTDKLPVQTLPEEKDNEQPVTEDEPQDEDTEKKLSTTARRGLLITFLVLLAGGLVCYCLLLDKNFTGWVFATLTSVFVGVFIWQAAYPPKKLKKPRQALAASLALLFFILPLTAVVGRTMNLSVQEKQDAASAQLAKDTKAYTQMLQFATACDVVLPPNPSVDQNVLRYNQGDCTVKVNLHESSVWVFPTTSLDESKTNVNATGVLTLTLRPDSGGTFYLNVKGFTGPTTEVPESDRQPGLSRYYGRM